MSKVLWKPWILNPIWHALVAWVLTILVATAIPTLVDLRTGPVWVFLVGLLLILVFAAVGVVVSISTYKITEHFLERLLLLYFAIDLLYATVYFWMIVIFDPEKPLDGFPTPWHWLRGTAGRDWIVPDAARTLVDCFHYSTVTITTLGFGDMHPVHWAAKLVTDTEVLAGVGLVAVGLGRYFGHSSTSAR